MIFISEVFGAGLSHKGISPKATYPTVQGEGVFTGTPTIFVRFFGCNLRCEGFSQPDPTNRDTYKPNIIQYLNPKDVKSLADFKTPSVGCDTAYAVYPEFKHLRTTYADAAELYHDAIEPLLYQDAEGKPTWTHPVTGNTISLCFTGGEPMMHQRAMAEILQYIKTATQNKKQILVQIETNGTKALTDDFYDAVATADMCHRFKVCFNISPKLFTVSGEPSSRAWDINSLLTLYKLDCSLKFVVNDTEACWNELTAKVKELHAAHSDMPSIYIMPAGAVYHQQTDQAYIRAIAERALKEGYCISPRLHVNIWDGCVGC